MHLYSWRYGTLFVDGKQYTGPGSLPSPDEQTAAAAARGASVTAASDADGFKTVQRRKPKGAVTHPNAAGSKKALFPAASQ